MTASKSLRLYRYPLNAVPTHTRTSREAAISLYHQSDPVVLHFTTFHCTFCSVSLSLLFFLTFIVSFLCGFATGRASTAWLCKCRLSLGQKQQLCNNVGHAAEETGDLLGEVTHHPPCSDVCLIHVPFGCKGCGSCTSSCSV